MTYQTTPNTLPPKYIWSIAKDLKKKGIFNHQQWRRFKLSTFLIISIYFTIITTFIYLTKEAASQNIIWATVFFPFIILYLVYDILCNYIPQSYQHLCCYNYGIEAKGEVISSRQIDIGTFSKTHLRLYYRFMDENNKSIEGTILLPLAQCNKENYMEGDIITISYLTHSPEINAPNIRPYCMNYTIRK